MSNQSPHTSISNNVLREEIKKEYRNVALYPNKGYHLPMKFIAVLVN